MRNLLSPVRARVVLSLSSTIDRRTVVLGMPSSSMATLALTT